MDISNLAEKLTTIAENQQRVYDAGVDSGIEVGKQAEYDAFWDIVQNKGKRTNYQYGFAGMSWNDTTFRPKYDIIFGTGCNQSFNGCTITNLAKILRDCGVILNTSKNDNNDYMFNGCQSMTHIPTIDLSGQNANRRTANFTFNICRKLVKIEKVILPSDGTMAFANTFYDCRSLVYVRFDGVIGNNISFAESPLDKESFEDVIAHLSDAATDKRITFKKTAKEAAFTDEEWSVLTSTKPNWTFNLV